MALSDNLRASWKFDESSGNPADSSGNGYTLTNNNTVGFAAALINNGANFGSGNTNKTLSLSSDLGMSGNSALTIAFWWKYGTDIASGTDVLARLTSTTTATRGVQFEYDYNGGTRQIRSYDGNTISSNTALGTGWHLLMYTRAGGSGSATEFFLDNVSLGTSTAGSDGLEGANIIRFGGATGAAALADGLLDIASVWNRVLNSTERAAYYNAGVGVQYPFNTAYTLACDVGTFTLTGVAAALVKGYNLVCSVGSFTLTGIAALLVKGYNLVCSTGTFTLTGIAALFKIAITFACATGSFVLTGVSAGLVKGYNLAVDTGAFVLTGIAAAFSRGYTAACATGAFVLTGVAATLVKGYSLVMDTGAFVLTGMDAAFSKGISMALSAGSFVLTGVAAAFSKGFHITADLGTFVLTGFAAKFPIFWRTLNKNLVTFANKVKNVVSWNNSDKTNI